MLSFTSDVIAGMHACSTMSNRSSSNDIRSNSSCSDMRSNSSEVRSSCATVT